MKKTRYEEYTQVMKRSIDQLSCDNCGTTVDTPSLQRPEGWTTLYREVEGKGHSWDFCEWDCVIGFVNAQPESGPGGYIDDWKASVVALQEARK